MTVKQQPLTDIHFNLKLFKTGKVVVSLTLISFNCASDRVSSFDVVMNEGTSQGRSFNINFKVLFDSLKILII